MTFTITIIKLCAGGGHIHLRILTGEGREILLTLNKSDFSLEAEDMDEVIPYLLRQFVKESGLTNWNQIKTAIEAKTFKI